MSILFALEGFSSRFNYVFPGFAGQFLFAQLALKHRPDSRPRDHSNAEVTQQDHLHGAVWPNRVSWNNTIGLED